MTGPRPRTVLLRQRDVQDYEATARGPHPPPDRLLRWGRPALLPLASAVAVRTHERVAALTYDDGPHPLHTPAVLDALDRRGVRATFFVLAQRAQEHPGLVRRMVARGHEVGLHGVDHTRLSDLPPREAARRIRDGRLRLEAVTGRPVRLFRPPYGTQSLGQYCLTRLMGLDVVLWTAWARDWQDDEAAAVADRAVAATHPGAIVLLHDTTDDIPVTPAADGAAAPAWRPPAFSRGEVAARVVDGLLARGYRLVPAGELMQGRPVVRCVAVPRPRLRPALRSRPRERAPEPSA